MHPKYLTLEYCLIYVSPYFIFSFLTFLILNLVPKSIDLILPSPKWILSSLLTNQSKMLSKFLFSWFSNSLNHYVDRQGMYYQCKEKVYI